MTKTKKILLAEVQNTSRISELLALLVIKRLPPETLKRFISHERDKCQKAMENEEIKELASNRLAWLKKVESMGKEYGND